MTRVATSTSYDTSLASILNRQTRLAQLNQQLTSGKTTQDYAGLGQAAARQVSNRSLMARELAYGETAKRTATTLSHYDHHLTRISDAAAQLRDSVAQALASDNAIGLSDAAAGAFATLKASLNADEAGVALFAGGRLEGQAFTPDTLADLAALPLTSAAFGNDEIRARARVGDDQELDFGLLANEIGGDFVDALKLLASGTPTGALDDATRSQLQAVLERLDGAATQVQSAQALNGQRAARVEQWQVQAGERATFLETVVSGIEDADPAETIARLQQEQTALQASYQAFSTLSQLSLLNFL